MTRILFRRHRLARPRRLLGSHADEPRPEAPPLTHPLRCGKLHGFEAGPADGPLVILLHGFPDFSWGWRHQVPALVEQGYRVVVPDQRGYALSDKPMELDAYRLDELVDDVLSLADALDYSRFRLIGHDWGGIVAWWAAACHPHRIEQLVAINAPHPDAWSHLGWSRWRQATKSWYVAFFQLPWLPELLLTLRNFALLRRTLQRSSRPGTFTVGVLDHYITAWSQPGALTAMLNYYRALRRRPAGPRNRVEPPTLLLWGELDHFLDRTIAEASLALCDNGHAEYFPHATHWLQLEEPESVNASILHFFVSHVAEAGLG